MQDQGLRELASLCQGEYFAAETSPFHLGDIYLKFAAGKERDGGIGADFDVIYKEASFFLIILVLVLFLILEVSWLRLRFEMIWQSIRKRATQASSILSICALMLTNMQAQGSVEKEFVKAKKFADQGNYDEAISFWEKLSKYPHLSSRKAQSMIAFNHAMSLKKSAQVAAESPAEDLLYEALSSCRQAQTLFLKSARLMSDFKRANQQLQQLDAFMRVLEKKIEQQEAKDDQLNAELQKILEQLMKLKEAQQQFEKDVITKGRLNQRRKKKRPKEQKVLDEQTTPSSEEIKEYSDQQEVFAQEGQEIYEAFVKIDRRMLSMISSEGSDQLPIESLLKEPVELMEKAVASQKKAQEFLGKFDLWWPATQRQREAVSWMEQILNLFPQQDNASSENSEDWEEMDEDYEDWEESEEGNPSNTSASLSSQMSGYSEIQDMPAPNFSAEEIMAEELQNQQFREQTRAKSKMGKVKKDW